MHRYLLIAVLAASSALFASGHQDILLDYIDKAPVQDAHDVQAEPTTATVQNVRLNPPGHEAIEAGPNGHFEATFRVNGRSVNGMVDTGATFVALNETTARQLGVSLSDLYYRYAVTTANGTTEAAHITLDRMEIGSVRVKDVEAFVLKDKSLSGMLVGMSFMNKLASYKVEDGVLYLKN
jgi:aspartyl protease family protein